MSAFVKSRHSFMDKRLGPYSERLIREFLESTANLPNPIDYPGHVPHFEAWVQRWGKYFYYEDPDEGILQLPLNELAIFAPVCRTVLRRIWSEPEARQRDWLCYRIRDVLRKLTRKLEGWGGEWPGPDTVSRLTDWTTTVVPDRCLLESAISWLHRHETYMRECGSDECARHYFLKRAKAKRQTYCTPECANTARRAAKRVWWAKNRGAAHLSK